MSNLVISTPQPPQLIANMSNADYHAHPAFSSSQIKDMLRTPAHFYAKHMGEKVEKAPTDNMLLGTVVHTLLLENDKFTNEYAISQKFDRRTKQGKADYEAFELANTGKTVIDEAMHQNALSIAESLKQHNVAKLLRANNAIAEASIFYTDSETGLNCRVRPDFHIPPCDNFPSGLIVDLKTTDNASDTHFPRTIVNFAYHLSASMYCDGFMQYYGTNTFPAFIWLVAEREAPYAVVAYSPDDEAMQKGGEKKSSAMRLLAECLQTGNFPAYSTEILNIELPKWA